MNDRMKDFARFMRAAKKLQAHMDGQLSVVNGNGKLAYAKGNEPSAPATPTPETLTPPKAAPTPAKPPSHPALTPLHQELSAREAESSEPAAPPDFASLVQSGHEPHVAAAKLIGDPAKIDAVIQKLGSAKTPEAARKLKAAQKIKAAMGGKAITPSPFPPDIKRMSGGNHPEMPVKPRVPEAIRFSEGGRTAQDPLAYPRNQHTLMVPLEHAFQAAQQEIQAELATRTHPEEREDMKEALRDLQTTYETGSAKQMVRFLEDNVGYKTFNKLVQATPKRPASTTLRQEVPAVPNVARPAPGDEGKPRVTPDVGGNVAPVAEAVASPKIDTSWLGTGRMPPQTTAATSPPVAQPPVAQQVPRSPAEQQLSQAILTHAQQAIAGSNLPPEYHKPFTQNLGQVLGQMPESALKTVREGVAAFSFHASPQDLATSLLQLGGSVADRVESIIYHDQIIGGVVHTGDDGRQTVYLDGGKDLHGSQPHQQALKRHGAEYYAHELGHILGASKNPQGERHDRTDDWEEIYSWEIGHSNALSSYATTSPMEAFAEFSRVLFSGLYDRAKLKGEFPRAYDYFMRNGWVADIGAARGGVKSANVFSHKVVLNRAGDHADIATQVEAATMEQPASQVPPQ